MGNFRYKTGRNIRGNRNFATERMPAAKIIKFRQIFAVFLVSVILFAGMVPAAAVSAAASADSTVSDTAYQEEASGESDFNSESEDSSGEFDVSSAGGIGVYDEYDSIIANGSNDIDDIYEQYIDEWEEKLTDEERIAVNTKIQDTYDELSDEIILTDEQKTELTAEIQDLYRFYDVEVALLISQDIGSYRDYREYAADYMQKNNVGDPSSTNGGLCIFHQPNARNITIVFRGSLQDDFTERIQDIMLDHATAALKDGDTFGAYQYLLRDFQKGCIRLHAGKAIRPMDLEEKSFAADLLIYLLISIAVMAIPTLCLTLYQLHRMKTKVPQTDADAYVTGKGLKLTDARDMFLYHTVTRTPKPKPENHPGGGGGGGSFSHGGESFSGSSRNY